MQSTSARRRDFNIIRQRRYALSRARKHRMRAVLLSRLVKRMRAKTQSRHRCKCLTCCNLIHAASKTGRVHPCIGAAVQQDQSAASVPRPRVKFLAFCSRESPVLHVRETDAQAETLFQRPGLKAFAVRAWASGRRRRHKGTTGCCLLMAPSLKGNYGGRACMCMGS